MHLNGEMNDVDNMMKEEPRSVLHETGLALSMKDY